MDHMPQICWASCKCRLTHDIFVPGQNLRVSYTDQSSFLAAYTQLFKDLGYSKTDLDEACTIAQSERKRREKYEVQMLENKLYNIKRYLPPIKDAFLLKKSDFRSEFFDLCERCQSRTVPMEDLMTIVEKIEGLVEVFRFPVLTDACLERLNLALDAFDEQNGRKSQPDTLTCDGSLLCEIPGSQARVDGDNAYDCGGADVDLVGSLLSAGLQCILARLYPDVGGKLDSYRAFTVQFVGPEAQRQQPGRDTHVPIHYDNSEITAEICLLLSPGCETGAGGEMCFVHSSPNVRGGESSEGPYAKLLDHRPGWVVLHRGSHVHQILPFNSSAPAPFRRSITCWLRSNEIRSSLCPRCFSEPQLVPMKVLHNGEYVDCTKLNSEVVHSGKFVRAGFADGFRISPT
ncbi:unnamed protein product [Calicophoron daubneyi]|uniref:Fe2OG dioxygenase domain-containing protein n=1 Tax=Calicophoron daubneyi TaxID=300641 RepID=A0AAV2TSK8_CALDB